MEKPGFLSYYFSMFVAPRRTFIKLLNDERRLRYGFAGRRQEAGRYLFYRKYNNYI